MAIAAAVQAELCRLRQDIARIEGRIAEAERLDLDVPGAEADRDDGVHAIHPAGPRRTARRSRVTLGPSALDRRIGGGLSLAALHEIRTRESRDGAAAGGFALALAARLVAGGAGSILWISEAESRRETGGLYAPGLATLGLDPARVIEVSTRRTADALWAFEAALSCHGVGVAVCELYRPSLDLSATRRCVLRARGAGVTGLLLRLAGQAEPSAAELRFCVASASTRVGAQASAIGPATWLLTLEKIRGGRTGRFLVEWNADERHFAEPARKWRAHPQPVPAAPAHRSVAQGGTGGGSGRRFRRVS